jgi:hypothetical protein
MVLTQQKLHAPTKLLAELRHQAIHLHGIEWAHCESVMASGVAEAGAPIGCATLPVSQLEIFDS